MTTRGPSWEGAQTAPLSGGPYTAEDGRYTAEDGRYIAEDGRYQFGHWRDQGWDAPPRRLHTRQTPA